VNGEPIPVIACSPQLLLLFLGAISH